MKNSQASLVGRSDPGKSKEDRAGNNRVAGFIRPLSSFCYMGIKLTRQAGLCVALFLISLLTPIVSIDAGDIFVSGYPVIAREGQNGYDKVILDYLRDGAPVSSYEIAVIGSGVAQNICGINGPIVPFSGVQSNCSYGNYDWSPDAKAVGYDLNTTYYQTDDLISGAAQWCDVLSKDCLVILSYESPHQNANSGDLSDTGVAEIYSNRADIICAFNAGMDLLVLSGGNSADYYDFLDPVGSQLFKPSAVGSSWYGPSPTIAGCQIGIRNDNVNAATCTPCSGPGVPSTPCNSGGMMLEEAVLNNYFGLVGADIATYSPLLTVMTTHDVDQNGSRYLPQMHEPSDWVVCLGAKNIQLPVPPGPTLCGIGNCTATPIEEFRRGDSNIDSSVNIADVIHILSGAFWGIPLQCEDASDSNDDEAVDISDAIHLVMYLFLGGPPPPTPGPVNCGPDPTGNGALDCQNYSGC